MAFNAKKFMKHCLAFSKTDDPNINICSNVLQARKKKVKIEIIKVDKFFTTQSGDYIMECSPIT